MVAVRRKRVLVPPERQKTSYQPRLDHVMLVMSHQVRIATLEFLSHSRLMGDALQPFSSIQRGIASKKNHVSTSDLDYHLKALIKALLIEKITNGDESAGYMLTEKGRLLVEKYLEMKNIQIEA
ncbi:MAG: hypothetical protein GYA24_12520, partial [Candidatus Lokiarchaeota archaeon]|nr:hypothetical protein [Candidatus Lokiarchaeota archaeon]